MKNLKMKKEFKVIADLLSNNTRVLDIGCGLGRFSFISSTLENKRTLRASKHEELPFSSL